MGSKGATTTSTTAPPQIVQDMYKYLTEQGKSLQQQQYTPYTGQLVAPLNEIQQKGLEQVQQYSQTAQPYYQGAAAGTLGALQGYTPQGFQQGVSGYLSPYIQNSLDLLANQQAQQRQELLGKTIQSGAFGGDRGKIAQAALMGQQNLATGQVLQQGFADAARNYMAGLAGQGAMSQQLGSLGAAAQTAGLSGAQAVSQAGTVPYNVAQAENAAKYQQFAQQQAYPFQTLGFLANIASGLGAGQGGTSVTTTPGPNALNQALGIGATLASLPWSDKRLKEDVKEVGKTFDGLPIYSFKYKGDDKTQIGLMAQDVEKKNPDAVGLAAGYKTVDYDKATEGAAERGKFNLGGSSMGGLVPAGQERQAYATRGATSFGLVPYVDDPLYAAMSDRAFAQAIGIVPALELAGAGLKIKEASEYEDKPSEFQKGLQAQSEWQKANMVKNIKSAFGLDGGLDRTTYETDTTDYSADPSFGSYGPRGLSFSSRGYNYADGGLVPRSHHADGETAQGNVPSEPFLKPGQTLYEKFSGQDLSPEARSGLLAAGLGMLSSRSPFFGVGIGEGGMAGLNTYYNAIKNKMEQSKAAAEIDLQGAQTEEARARARNIPMQYSLDAFRARAESYKQAQEALPLLQQRARAYLARPGGEIPPELQNSIDSLLAIIAKGPPQLGGPTPTVSPSAKAPVATQPSTAPAGAEPKVPASAPSGEVPKGVVVPPSEGGAAVKPQTSLDSKAPVEASAKMEAAKSGFNLPPNYDPDALLAQADKAAELGYFDTYKDLRDKAFKLIEDISKDGGIYIEGKFVPLPNYSETMAARKGAETSAQKAAEAPYEFVEQMDDAGNIMLVPKSEALKKGPITKSLSGATLETQKGMANINVEKNKEAGTFLAELPAVQQIQNGLINAYSKIDMNRATPLQADIIGTIKSFPSLDRTLKSMGIDVDAQGFQGMADVAAKDAITEAFKSLAANTAGRTTNMQLKETLMTVAEPEKAPAAKYAVVTQNSGRMLQQEAMWRDWNKVSGKENWNTFIDRWTADPEHSIEYYTQKAVDKTPYFAGMTAKDIENLEYKRGQEKAPKSETSKQKTVVRTGTVTSGVNAGKTVTEYSDGTREYK